MTSDAPWDASLEAALPPLKVESLQCIRRLQSYKRARAVVVPKSRTAAVAVILFVGRLGDLYVLLSSRAGSLSSYASDTALPGGKYDETDEDEEATARREAFEEIGMPLDTEKIRFLCLLDQFLTGNSLVVTPVVLLVTENSIYQPALNLDEVSGIFSMPLAAFLVHRPNIIPGWSFGLSQRVHPIPPELVPPPPLVKYATDEGEVGGKEGAYHGYRDISWGEGKVRMHRFLTGREAKGSVKPVFGLTAAILIRAAWAGYDRNPTFGVYAEGQYTMDERIRWALEHDGPLRDAAAAEGWAPPRETVKAHL